jgi:hypothetical protein|tara:strand:+ start:479 stop:676 length:198 start_codon:yes stop_codon:yes gene_type:complete
MIHLLVLAVKVEAAVALEVINQVVLVPHLLVQNYLLVEQESILKMVMPVMVEETLVEAAVVLDMV